MKWQKNKYEFIGKIRKFTEHIPKRGKGTYSNSPYQPTVHHIEMGRRGTEAINIQKLFRNLRSDFVVWQAESEPLK